MKMLIFRCEIYAMDINEVKIKILLLASNPKNTRNLRISEEFREIKESIKLSENSQDFDIFEGSAVRAKDFRRLILEISPHIIHYSGHGEDEGILLENNQGNTNLIEGNVLEELFSLFDSINCIILNSCYSVKQANYLRKVVPYIIGMQKSIRDQSAIYFSTGFYDAIASKRTIEDAFDFGVNAIRLHTNDGVVRSIIIEEKSQIQIPEANIPILIKGSVQRDLPTINSNISNTKPLKSFVKTIIKWIFMIIFIALLYSSYFVYKENLPISHILIQPLFKLNYELKFFSVIPKMVVIPAKQNLIGENEEGFGLIYKQNSRFLFEGYDINFLKERSGYPGRSVEIEKKYMLSRYEISFLEYDYYVWQERKKGVKLVYPKSESMIRFNYPVVNITLNDALKYTDWLSRNTNKKFRLPTEVEWEFAARGNSKSIFHWGNEYDKDKANCGLSNNAFPVGSYPANNFGLFDTSGNVWELTCSMWNPTYNGVDEDKCATLNNSRFVMRGSSFSSKDIEFCTSSRREIYLRNFKRNDIGFRVLQEY